MTFKERRLHGQAPDVVLVTGSSGLIGRAVAERFSGTYDVVGFDREGPPPHPPVTVECVCVDLTSEESVREAFARIRYAYGERIASVVHLAAYYDFSGEPSPKYEEVTVRGTERLLRALREFEVEQFVFSSTMLAHAPCKPGERIKEDRPLEPKWDYPKSKVATEELIRAKRGSIPAVILRIAGVYDDLCRSIPLAHQIQRIYERQLLSHVFPGDLSHGQSFLHLDDLVAAIEVLPRRRGKLPDELVLLLGEPDTVGYGELQKELGRLIHGEEWETREIPKALAKAGAWLEDTIPGEEPFIKPWMIDLADDHFALDIGRARKILDWEPKRSLRETLPKMVEALKGDPARFYRENKLEGPGWLESLAARQEGTEKSEVPRADPGKETAPHREHKTKKAGMDHRQMVIEIRRDWLWTNFTIAALGLWLMSSPFTFGYSQRAMIGSDLVSGALLLLLSLLATWPRMDFWGRWGAAFVGVWLQFAPLLFWAKEPAAYLNDTLVGAFAIALSILVPMMPGMAHHMAMSKPGPEIPPGWTYNPSTWHQRAPMIALAILGWFVSRYLAAVQLGYIGAAWEPFFGEGTARVLHSKVSRMWPISDAGLGAVAYTFEALMGFMGGKSRWRTMPWMVTFFGILVVPLGITHILLVILQPVVVGHWCTLCLTAASVMLLMIPLALDEVVAMLQFLGLARREGKSLWRTFWVGDTIRGGSEDRRTPAYGSRVFPMAPSMVWGVTTPWNLIASIGIGVWLMFAPAVLGSSGRAADSDHLAGALIVTTAAIATAEVTRAGRYLNLLLAGWVVLAPWLLPGAGTGAKLNDVLAGALVAALSLRRGAVRQRYGAWDRYIV